MENTAYIYILLCPIENNVKYVGRTFGNLRNRLSCHITSYKSRTKIFREWMEMLEAAGKRKQVRILLIEQPDARVCRSREKYWIQHFLKQGCELANVQR